MRRLGPLLTIILLPTMSSAKVPYLPLENLRQETVVIRVALDQPESARVKNCKLKPAFAELGAKLSLDQDNAAKTWDKVTVTAIDLPLLRTRIRACVSRGSCQVYDVFLTAALKETAVQKEIESLQKELNGKLEKMTGEDYARAWDGIKNACEILQKNLGK